MLHPLRTGLAATLLLAACSEAPAPDNEAAEADNAPVATPMPAATPAASEPSGAPRITAAGYDTIRIGQSPDAATGYALKDAGDMPGECRTFTSPKLPEAYVMVQDGLVRRITFFAPEPPPFSSSSSCASSTALHPSICTRNSDLTRLDASCSPLAPLDVHSESISSMKMVDGA